MSPIPCHQGQSHGLDFRDDRLASPVCGPPIPAFCIVPRLAVGADDNPPFPSHAAGRDCLNGGPAAAYVENSPLSHGEWNMTPFGSSRVARGVATGLPDTHRVARHPSVSEGGGRALRLEPLYHQDIAGICRSKEPGCAERGSMSLRSMGVWNSVLGVWNYWVSGTPWAPIEGYSSELPV